ncbi:MAG: phage head-tail connector protein [Hyphomonadaceae bacterium]|nr:phage head-tail connector protein [Hyphomonadaceae bacterium]
MTDLTVISPPAEEPVTLAAAKQFLRIGHDGEDDLVTRFIQSARARIEQAAGLAFIAQTLRVDWQAWPSVLAGRGALLPRRPAVSLISVVIVAEAGDVTDHTDRFRLDCGRLGLRPWSQLPVIAADEQIEVTYQAGYGTASDVPEDLKEAILRLAGVLYAARAPAAFAFGASGALPEEVRAILEARREVRL